MDLKFDINKKSWKDDYMKKVKVKRLLVVLYKHFFDVKMNVNAIHYNY